MPHPYRFETHYHPYVCDIRGTIAAGTDGVMAALHPKRSDDLARQRRADGGAEFAKYVPDASWVDPRRPSEDIDFSPEGAYSQYNWELFFHIPLLVATQLSLNRRFEEAQQWFHTIFDPTDQSVEPKPPQRYWQTKPFFLNADVKVNIARMLELLDAAPGADVVDAFRQQIRDWMDHPFSPHRIARSRISAYQKAVVMKYLDNLIAWGDELFARETIEAINEATHLYVLAAEILGDRPQELPKRNVPVKTYRDLAPTLDLFSNAVVALEGFLPAQPAPSTNGSGPVSACPPPPKPAAELTAALAIGQGLYFCVPQNDVLLGYWDTVADRLFKIRNCMDLEGRVRQLPLFEPPIDPALLVRAVAAGVDLGSVLSDLYAPRPHYRFATMLQRALDYANEVKSLGAALLAAMEKRDAEELARLRSTHEIALLDATRDVRRQQIDDATHALEALQKAQEMVAARHSFYENFEKVNTGEELQLALMTSAAVALAISQEYELTAVAAHLGQSILGAVGPFPAGMAHLGASAEASGKKAAGAAAAFTTAGTMSGLLASHARRKEDAELQAQVTALEGEQLEAQILGAEVRLELAKTEFENLDLQRRQAKELDSQMRRKFTNRELYTWTVTQVSRLYFQSYRLAYDFAKRVEKTLAYELGPAPAVARRSYVEHDAWDSLHKGLLAGERLALQLRRMEAAYLDENRREYELSKSLSLAMLDPMEFLRLKQTGRATMRIPERLFDLDYPGHYMRRIKSVALTVPCVTGPYTSVNCTLTLMRNRMRHDPRPSGTGGAGSKYEGSPGDGRFTENVAAIESIATSGGVNDSGLFELNSRDERYLPFEGAGADSEWLIELEQDTNQFDVQTLSDVILHMRYMARPGGEPLRQAARDAIVEKLPKGLMRLFSAKHQFSDAWYRFLQPTSGSSVRRLDLDCSEERFPFHPAHRGDKRIGVRITAIDLYLKLAETAKTDPDVEIGALVLGPTSTVPADPKVFKPDRSFKSTPNDRWMLRATSSSSFKPASAGHLAVVFESDDLTKIAAQLDDLLLICEYELI